jgi:LuxR family transcriptional regulator, maltose regulon positive regulatory protein
VQWFDQISEHATWVSLDKNDRDPDRFLSYFIPAVRGVFPGFGSETESLLSSPKLPPPEYLADVLISDLASVKKPLVIVLDDFHTIVSEPVQMMLTRVVKYMPDNLHLVISTRVDPPLPLAKWRVRNWIEECGAADLCFSKEEAQAFFEKSLKKPLSAETLDLLQRQTEGWVTGLQLARLSLTDAENPDQYAMRLSGSDRYTVDFFAEEIVSKQPAKIKNFLAVTAVFDRFCPSLCDYVIGSNSGMDNSWKLIAKIERDNLFLVPLDSQRCWYRYHHLFQNLLIQHLNENISAKQKIEIQRRAGKWFAGQGLTEEALQYFLAAGDVNKAAELVELNLDDTLDSDLSRRTLSRWLEMFPKSAEKQHPALLVARVYCKILHWDFDGMHASFLNSDSRNS